MTISLTGKVGRAIDFRLRTGLEPYLVGPQAQRIERGVQEYEAENPPEGSPVLFFNASTRIWGLSQNAAFSLLAAWGLRLGGLPVRYFVCEAGMEQCVLGAIARKPEAAPPCRVCIRLSDYLYPQHLRDRLRKPKTFDLEFSKLEASNSLDALRETHYRGFQLGEMCLPSLRWVLRRHNLEETASTLGLYRRYLLSAAHIVDAAHEVLERTRPRAVVVFNGISFPEAVLREVALRHGIPVITHEVGIRPLTAFFTHGHATAYLLDIPEAFKLTPRQDAELDSYLGQRFQGNFTMAGIQFWPEMERLDRELLEKIERFDDVVVVFTNVIFDTSQVHANILFEDMFVWLRSIVDFARRHPQTLFVIRAHPDELRPGKESRETVQQHLEEAGAFELPNLEFLEPTRYVSSYELIQRAKYVMVYNSTIGLEATLLGKVVLCGGQARYTAYPTAYLPEDREGYFTLAERFLAEENPAPPQEFREHARRFTYYQHYHSSLDFSRFLLPHQNFPGYVRFSDFDPLDLCPGVCEETAILASGVRQGASMVYPVDYSKASFGE